MRTPAGFECRFFYGDYRRGRNHEECRLLLEAPTPQRWTPDLCKSCPVPGILRANSCPNMVLEPIVKRKWLGLRRQVTVQAYCTLSQGPVAEPHVGCGQCHPLPPIFTETDDPNAAP